MRTQNCGMTGEEKVQSAWAKVLTSAAFLMILGLSFPAAGEDSGGGSLSAHFRLLNYKFSVDRQVNSAHAHTPSSASFERSPI